MGKTLYGGIRGGEGVTIPLNVMADTKISDTSGKSRTIPEIHEGNLVTIDYIPEASGALKATTLIISPN